MGRIDRLFDGSNAHLLDPGQHTADKPELIAALGVQVGLAAWDVGHGQPDKPDLFECREDYYHFPCGMCKYRANEPELRCVGCRHYCP